MKLPNKISELRDPNTLKTGHIATLSKGRKLVVKRDKNNVAKYVKASKNDIKCSNSLKRNIKNMIEETKTKKNRIKNYNQALAIAYNKTKKQFPNCKLLNNNKTKKNMYGGSNINKKIAKLQRKILKILIKKEYIKQQPTCKSITKIKHLYIDKSKMDTHIRNIRNKKSNISFPEYFRIINSLLQFCKKNIYNKDINFSYNGNMHGNLLQISINASQLSDNDKFISLYNFVNNTL